MVKIISIMSGIPGLESRVKADKFPALTAY